MTSIQRLGAVLSAIDPTTGHDEEWGKAAPIGLLVLLLLGIAMYFLGRSMSRNLKKVPASFETPMVDVPATTERSAGGPGEVGRSAGGPGEVGRSAGGPGEVEQGSDFPRAASA